MQNYDIHLTVIILTEKGYIRPPTVDKSLKLGSVYILRPPEIGFSDISGAVNISCEKPVPHHLNEILNECGSEYLAVISDDVVIDDKLNEYLRQVPHDAGYIYGDYIEITNTESTEKEVYQGPEDITERADLGQVAIYRTKMLKEAGGWNKNLKYAFDYDLRLRLGASSRFYRIPKPICTLLQNNIISEESKKLFFPGKGKYGGFSYLFMDPAEEKEIEFVFLQSLKRRGAYLEGEAGPFRKEPEVYPMVSVITPVYNREKFIGQAIESVIGGEFRDFEYIIIDNGSTDNTIEIVEKYAAKDPRIKLIRNNINRIAKSLNLGLQKARGKYISQLDSDDLYTLKTMKSMVEFMEDSNCALGISYYSLIDESGTDLPEFGIIKHLEYSRNNILRVDGAGAVRMWRKSAMMEFGGFDADKLVDYGEDYDLVLKIGEKYKVGRVHEVLYKYRRHPDNSDVLRDPLFKLRNKNLARERALVRRIKMNEKSGEQE